ncbi:MAG: RIP metalloprotease RseP [Mycobacterium leprae]
MYVLSAIVALLIILTVHEGGHFVGARAAGMRVLEMALGWGKRLWSVRRGETQYSVNLVPLLAYVAVDTGEPGSADPRIYRNRSVWGRIGYVLGGPLGNMVFAAALLIVLLLIQGVPRVDVYVGSVEDGKPAAAAGLKPGDQVVNVGGHPMTAINDMAAALQGAGGQNVPVTVKRDGQTLQLTVVPVADTSGVARIGVTLDGKTYFNGRGTVWERVALGWRYFVNLTKQITRAYVDLFSGRLGLAGLGGPVAMVSEASQVAMQGWQIFMMMVAGISINVGLLNLIPLPALDGGRLVFLLLEAVFGLRIREERQEAIHSWGLMTLLVLMVVITARDVVHLF